MLTTKAIQLATSDHSIPATPLPLLADAIVVDKCLPQKRNHFQTTLAAGDRLNCVAYSQQIDSKAALNLLLLDPAGKELMRSRSIGAWPAELQFTAKAAGDYMLVVYDFLYQGGDDYPFLLEAVVTDQTAEAGPLELNALLRPAIHSQAPQGLDVASVDARSLQLDAAGLEAAAEASPYQVPFTVRGDFTSPQTDFDFQAKAGQQLSIDVVSAQLDQLTDPRLVLYKVEKGGTSEERLSQLAEQDDAAILGDAAVRIRRLDPSLVWTPPEDASYRISLRDSQAGERPSDAQQFVLVVRQAQPGFELVAYSPYPSNNVASSRHFGSNLLLGSTDVIHVVAMRRGGFNGPVEVSIENLPAGLTCAPAIIPPSSSETDLILQTSDDAAAWQGSLNIVGRSQIGEQTVEVQAAAASVIWPAVPTKNAIQARRAQDLAIAVNAHDQAPLLVELGAGNVLEVAQGGKLTLPIKATRRPGSAAECVLRPKMLPPKVTLPETKIPADKAEASVEMAVAADAPTGEYTLWMQNETKVKWRANPQQLAREEAYLAKLKAALETTTEAAEKQKIEAAVTATTSRVEELKKQTAEQEFTVWLPTTPQRIRILPATK